jgi:hypothetical protein
VTLFAKQLFLNCQILKNLTFSERGHVRFLHGMIGFPVFYHEVMWPSGKLPVSFSIKFEPLIAVFRLDFVLSEYI